MQIQALSEAVHKNAVEHGWWDGERNLFEIIALIHSEWSEALEEARAGSPLVYYRCFICNEGPCIKEEIPAYEKCAFQTEHHKPEGIAIELIDGVIRILDLFGYVGIQYADRETGYPASMESLWGKAAVTENAPEDAPTLIAFLHRFTSDAILDDEEADFDASSLLAAMSLALTWVHEQGIDPMKLLTENTNTTKRGPISTVKHSEKRGADYANRQLRQGTYTVYGVCDR